MRGKKKREEKKKRGEQQIFDLGRKNESGEAIQSGRKKGKGGRKDEKWGSFLI